MVSLVRSNVTAAVYNYIIVQYIKLANWVMSHRRIFRLLRMRQRVSVVKNNFGDIILPKFDFKRLHCDHKATNASRETFVAVEEWLRASVGLSLFPYK